jgi:hypothetical protein
MVPLPDGTFLIVNGAKEGVAGFKLAGDPNFDAVLYNPTQPIGQRFSMLASTTIPRLYHSEAILLPDARVLISGSDPQTPGFPQEKRIEVSYATSRGTHVPDHLTSLGILPAISHRWTTPA